MFSLEYLVFMICISISFDGGFLFVLWYFSRVLKVLTDRIDKLVLQVESLEMERDKLEK